MFDEFFWCFHASIYHISVSNSGVGHFAYGFLLLAGRHTDDNFGVQKSLIIAESFDDFYNYTGGTVIGRNTKRTVQKLTFGEGAEHKVFFMKRFYKPHFKDMVTTLWNCGRLTSQAG